ncbi:tellurite resistance TerB family protein [Profundibacter amoris]|uniref:TerB family tellurite resistance protein n=1 Tax=Profundibacter amoris TaxID=2171755 RepID=A0A347UIV0_9RHOB|nr:DUF533 domain-containing protein [Profundibacter amoris]AXX98778.1 TerB family tellurite resistance protein [Profundibacter amoris]
MRFIAIALFALALQFWFPASAQARGLPIVYGTQDSLDLVAQTGLEGPDGKPLSLCHYSSKYHVFYVGFWMKSHGYALAANGCDGDTYYDISKADFKDAQNSGLIPADLPAKPKMTLNQIASGFGGLALVGLVILFLLTKTVGSARRKSARKSQMGQMAAVATQIVDAMCHAAISDGELDDSEVATIAGITKQMIGEELDEDRIRLIISKASAKPTDNEFKAFGAGLGPVEKELVLKAVFAVIAADGQIVDSEHEFFIKTTQALAVDADTVRRIVADVRDAR